MAESGQVRLVRCPICETLLPELPDYSVYQCGGCGAALRAKKSDLEGDRVSAERPSDARPGVLSERSDNFLGKPEKFSAKPVSRVRSREGAVSDGDRSSGAVAESRGSDSKEAAEKWGIENGETGRSELGNGSLKFSNIDQAKTHVERANGLMSSMKSIKQKTPERGERDGFGRLCNGECGGVRFRPLNHAGEGTSRYYANGNERSTTVLKNPIESSICNGAECAKPNREGLLRKLEELRQQLSQSCDINDKPDSRMFHSQEPCADSDSWFNDLPSRYQRGSRQFCDPKEHGSRSRYYDYHHEPISALDRYENCRLSAQDLSLISGCENSFGPHLSTRHLPHRIPGCSQNPRSHPYFSGLYPSPELGPFERNQVDSQFPCSCSQCYQTHIPIQMPPSLYKRYPLVPNKSLPHHHENHGAFASRSGYHSRISHLHPNGVPCEPHLHLHNRWPNDVNLGSTGVAHSQAQRIALASGGRLCRPIAGGAPFITCHNCFVLLELPKKVSHLVKSKWKICCGGCSSVISFTLVDDKLDPVETPLKKNLVDALDSSDEVMHDKPYDPHRGMRWDNAGFHSKDNDNSNYDFQSMDKEHVSSSTVQDCNLTKSEELLNLQLPSSSTSEDGDSHRNMVVANGVKSDNESPVKTVLSPPPPGSPLQEHFDHSSSKYRAVNRCGKGNLSSRSDQERVVSGKTCLRQNSLQESLANEMEIFHNDCSNTMVSHDNANINKEEDHPKGKRGVDSFFAGIIKKSFRDLSKSSHAGENCKRKVTVNGHLILDKSVKKAEKLAGPISPGQYWYDYRAGFWGVMGGPCLGIIPPHIEEFDYPMLEKCAGGNTGVFVNGRELHQKDLELLVNRGLPATRHLSYIIEISGRVLDEDSGEELDSLGKLAPTVEKVKHGFGMRDPKDAAQLT